MRFEYKRAIINFTYTFSWDVSKISFPEIVENELRNKDTQWEEDYLFNRPLCHNTNKSESAYHPNLVSKSLKVFHKQFTIDENALLILPNKQIELPFKLNCTIRFNENGTGVCTFTTILTKNITFENIHLLLHLASTINTNDDNWDDSAFIKNKNHYRVNDKENSIVLIDFFNYYLKESGLPTLFYDKKLSYDYGVLSDKENLTGDWQTPFTTTFLEVDKKSYIQFIEQQDKDLLKEFISIAGRLSSSNDSIDKEYLKILREYIFRSYDSFYLNSSDDEKRKSGRRIKNYSHHKDLFYTIDKRGAIAITYDFDSSPSFFVLPTFLNLVEILRSRWHIGSIVNLKLDELFEELSEDSNLSKIQNDIFKCRKLYGLFLKDPTPYLFDGGAITEIAETGDEIFWLKKLSIQMSNKLSIIDKLIDDIYSLTRYKNLEF